MHQASAIFPHFFLKSYPGNCSLCLPESWSKLARNKETQDLLIRILSFQNIFTFGNFLELVLTYLSVLMVSYECSSQQMFIVYRLHLALELHGEPRPTSSTDGHRDSQEPRATFKCWMAWPNWVLEKYSTSEIHNLFPPFNPLSFGVFPCQKGFC